MDALATVAADETDVEDWRLPHLAACMKKIPTVDQELLAMRFEQDQSLVEISGKVRKSEAAVGMAMMRIRRWLRDCMIKTMAMEKAGIT
jgi:DNA-directed RNA polymerase specialized sigma24 family protein